MNDTEKVRADRMEKLAERLTVTVEVMGRSALPRLSNLPLLERRARPEIFLELDAELGGDVQGKLDDALNETGSWVGDALAEFREQVEA